jgi:nucleoid DNA-binding protein
MTKKEIVRTIAAELGVSQGVVRDIVQRTFSTVIETLVREKRIELRNFGVFEIRVRAPRQARNPRTNERLEVPARAVVVFRAGKQMSDRVASLPVAALGRTLRRQLDEPAEDHPPAAGRGEGERPGRRDLPAP